MTPDLSTPNRPPPSPWPARAALGFVLATLVALVGVPILVQQRVDTLRAQVESVEPARTLVTRLQFNLAREMAALSELLLTGDPAYSSTYAAAAASERRVLGELEVHAARLGPTVSARFDTVRSLADQWHARVSHPDALRRELQADRPLQFPRERETFERALAATGGLEEAIRVEAERNREEIRQAEQAGLALTFGLGVLALLAAGTVAALTRRVRRHAEESERRSAQAEAAMAELGRANEARTRLLRGITHDVKNPLGAAKGYAQLLEMEIKAPLAPEQAPLVEGIKRSVDGALAIIADLLDLARADSGGLAVHHVEADLAAVAGDAVEDHHASAEAAGHALELKAPQPLVVLTDPARVAQVLANLISNAIKYTPPPGRITVRARAVDGVPERPGAWAAVEVSDTGPGIPAEQRQAVFDEFTRLERDSGKKGHGLGLPIARRIARLLDGDLTVAEAEGGGSTFILWLPRREDAGDAARARGG